jgi:hypothetical protein
MNFERQKLVTRAFGQLATLIILGSPLVKAYGANNATFPAGYEWVVGAYEGRVGNNTRHATIRIQCNSSRECQFVYEVVAPDTKPMVNTYSYRNAAPAATLKYARNALSYARDMLRKGSKPFPGTDDEAFREKALTFLESNADIEQCIDPNPATDGRDDAYYLLCKPSSSPFGSKTILLFATVLSGCQPAFCRYVILPLHPAARSDGGANRVRAGF